MKDIEDLARIAVDCGLQLHRDLGPGLLESVYESVVNQARNFVPTSTMLGR